MIKIKSDCSFSFKPREQLCNSIKLCNMEIPCMLKISWTNLESIVCSSSIALFYFTGLFVFRCSSVNVYSMQFFLRVILLLKTLTNNFDDECPFITSTCICICTCIYIYYISSFVQVNRNVIKQQRLNR